MSKQLTLTLGGKEQVLEFGKFYFQKFYGEATGNDPLNYSNILIKPAQQFDFVIAIVLAGLKTQYKVDNKPVDFTKDDVENWIGLMDEKDVAKIITDYTALNKGEGEVEPHLNGAEKVSPGDN